MFVLVMMMQRTKPFRGISDLMATILLVAVTLIAGAALFGWVNGQAAANENQIGASGASNINNLNEKFSVPTMVITASSDKGLVYVYNYGGIDLKIVSILVTGQGGSGPLAVQFTDSASCGASPKPACYTDSLKPGCDSQTSQGFTVSSPQPESHINNVPLPAYSFTISCC